MADKEAKDKISRGTASQFFVAGELCRRGYVAVVTMGNTPNTDILCSNTEGIKFVHIQVKTYVPGNKTVSVGKKAEKYYSENFIWVLAGIPKPNPSSEKSHASSEKPFEYFIVPSSEVSKNVKEAHETWLKNPGKNGDPHKDSNMRIIHLPPYTQSYCGWKIDQYKNAWTVIDKLLS